MEFRPSLLGRVATFPMPVVFAWYTVYAALGADYPEAAWLLLASTVATGAFAWRAWCLRVTADDDGVLVANYLSTVYVPWADVAGFPATRNWVTVRRRDGRQHTIRVLQTSDWYKGRTSPKQRARRDAFVAALQEEHRRRVPEEPPPDPLTGVSPRDPRPRARRPGARRPRSSPRP